MEPGNEADSLLARVAGPYTPGTILSVPSQVLPGFISNVPYCLNQPKGPLLPQGQALTAISGGPFSWAVSSMPWPLRGDGPGTA